MSETPAPTAPAAPSPATLIDVIVLVFAKSELKAVVGTDALRTVLEGSQRSLFPAPQTMTLQPVYDLLADQPGFDQEKVVAPMCRLKSWEGMLKTRVVMPDVLKDLDRRTIDDKAMGVSAFESDLEKLLNPSAVPSAPKARVIESGAVVSETQQARGGNRRVQLAALAALIGLGAAGTSLYFTFFRADSGDNAVLSPKDISDQIPIKAVQKSPDGVIVGVLGDASWVDKPEETRRIQLTLTIDRIRAQNGIAFMLVDPTGKPVGSVFVRNNKPSVVLAPQPAEKPKK